MDVSERTSSQQARHPWEVARFRFFQRVLRHGVRLPADARILDVGAGDGWFSSQLVAQAAPANPIVCWDTAYGADDASLQNSHLRPTVERPAERFDLLLLLDVLEHVAEDTAFLRLLVEENLAAGGYVLISVPCWPGLFSGHDRRLHHVRRYTADACRRLIRTSGLTIVQSGGLFYSLLAARGLLVGVERLLRRDRPHAHVGEARFPASWEAVFLALLTLDASFSWTLAKSGYSLPGLSWWALCQKS
jgi:hypothetical protein